VLHKDLPLGYLLVSKLPWANETLIYEMLSYLQSITNIVVMGNENKKLFKIKLTKEALSSELKVARAMQDLLVPQELPHTPIFKASAIYMPNKDVGGDYYDCQQLSADEWIFCVADVVGKGVPAALFMANVQANLRLLIDTTISLKTLIEQLAARIYNNTQGDKYVTMFVAKLNTKTGALEYINAGHVQPIVCYPNGKIQRLTQGTIPLGILPILPFLNIGTTHLPQGAMLMAFTDGVSEIIDLQGTMYDHEMLEKFVCQNTTLLPKAFNGALLENMKKFSAIPHFNDDVTVLTLRYDQP
jgi:sigma-B regulation protein RsbU (phosphoserine phosphatase)